MKKKKSLELFECIYIYIYIYGVVQNSPTILKIKLRAFEVFYVTQDQSNFQE